MNVKVNKSLLKAQYPDLIIEDPIFEMALNAFLDGASDAMPAEMFGRLVGEHWLNPEKLLQTDPEEAPETTADWSASITVVGDRLTLTVRHNDKEVVYGKSYVQDNDDLGMMQAISYAAHMCYKMVQQRPM